MVLSEKTNLRPSSELFMMLQHTSTQSASLCVSSSIGLSQTHHAWWCNGDINRAQDDVLDCEGAERCDKVVAQCTISAWFNGQAYSAPESPPMPEFWVQECVPFFYSSGQKKHYISFS